MSDVVSIICFLIFFILILWIYNYSKRKKELRGKEAFWGKIGNFFKKTFNSAINFAREQAERLARIARENAERLYHKIFKKQQEARRKAAKAEADRKRNEALAALRAALAKDFNALDSIPAEYRQYLVAEIKKAENARREWLEAQELERKRIAYKVIMRIIDLTKNFDSPDAVRELTNILEDKNSTYPINKLKDALSKNDVVRSMLDILRKSKITSGDFEELKIMASLLREYNCNNEQWCYANESQWKYSRT